MINKKTLIKFITLSIIFFSNTFFPVWGMDSDIFKIKFAREDVKVRTTDDEYVWSTWEDAVKNQGLAEKSAREAGLKVDGMCASHAVVCALEYVHERSDLLASYLHKAVTGGYSGGMHVEEAMNFVTKHGVMALPRGQKPKHGSGLPWPGGRRYKFTGIFDPYLIYNIERFGFDHSDNVTGTVCPLFGPAPKSESSKVFKYILKKYNHPIVVTIHSGYRGYPKLAPFRKYRGTLDTDVYGVNTSIEPEDIRMTYGWLLGFPELEKTYHAIVIYGYKESTKRFLVKNSWGPRGNNGVCTLPYDYFDNFARSAFVGFGHEDWKDGGLYGDDNGRKVAIHCSEQIRSTASRDADFMSQAPDLGVWEAMVDRLKVNHSFANTDRASPY